MSTVLDALAKADRKTSGSIAPGAPPPAGPPPRSRVWRILALVILIGGTFVVGMFTGDDEAVDGDTSSSRDAQLESVPADSGVLMVANDEVREVREVPDDRDALEDLEGARVDPSEEIREEDGAVARRLPGAGKAPKRRANEARVAAENGAPGDPVVAREVWRDQRMAARDAARASRKSVAQGELSREEYREERREQRALMKQERSANQAGRRAAQLERRNELRALRRARSAEKPDMASAVVAPAEAISDQVATSEDADTDNTASAGRIGDPLAVPPTVVPVVTAPLGAPAEPPEGHSLEVRRWMPTGAPVVRIQILQWSQDDERRFAFLSVDGGRATRVNEGAVLGAVQVKAIYREMIEIEVNGNRFLLRAN